MLGPFIRGRRRIKLKSEFYGAYGAVGRKQVTEGGEWLAANGGSGKRTDGRGVIHWFIRARD